MLTDLLGNKSWRTRMHPVYSLSVLSCEGRYHACSVTSMSRERFEVGLSVQRGRVMLRIAAW
jgi:hypothetical protein